MPRSWTPLVSRASSSARRRPSRPLLTAGLSDGGYALPGHEVKDFQGKLARGRVVRTKTDQARYSEAKRKTLSKALGAANG